MNHWYNHPKYLTLRVLIKSGSARHRADRLRQARLATVDVTQDADVEVEDGRGRHGRVGKVAVLGLPVCFDPVREITSYRRN